MTHTTRPPVRCLLLLVLLALALTNHAWAATYYVATTGTDSGSGAARCTRATTVTTPLLTINVGLSCANPGDTVQVAAGTYTQRVDLNSVANGIGGTAGGGYITLQGSKAVGPTVTNKVGATKLHNPALGNVWMVYGRHNVYMKIRNFEITGAGGGIGIFGNFHFIEVTDNYLHDNRADVAALSAIRPTSKYSLASNQVYCCEFGSATNLIVARNQIQQWTTGFNSTLPTQGTEAMTVAADVSRFLIEDNLVQAGQFIGIDLIGKSVAWWTDNQFPTLPVPPQSWPHEGIIRRNTIKLMRVGFGAADVGIYCDGCRDIVVEDNRIEDSPGYCLAMSTEENQFLIRQIIVRRNIGINCGTAMYGIGPGVTVANPAIHGLSEHLRVAHNTGLKTKPNGPVLRLNWVPGTQVKNNIFAVSASVKVPYMWHSAGATNTPGLNYNLYWGSPPTESWEWRGIAAYPFATYQATSGQEANSLVADPKFTNVATRNLTLQATSPALNRGAPLTLTVGAGSGTVVPVQDAHWFSNGYGMVPGDTVQVGTQLAVVTAVNYSTNQLTLDRSLTWTAGLGVTYPYSGSAPDLGACEGVGTCGTVAPPVPPPTPTIPAPTALRIRQACGTPDNSLGGRIMGTLTYLAASATSTAETLVEASCASGVTMSDSASVLPSAFPLVPPWSFLGTPGPNTGNTCTNCLSVHGGTPSVQETGAGYTLTTFQQGPSVPAATGGVSAFTALPGLCRQVVDGVVTSTPLWPWPMEARIAQARSLAGAPPVNVTLAVEAALGPIPAACRVQPPGVPQTVWVLAPGGATPPGIDGPSRACSLDQPCATFAHVAQRMGSGHTLLARGGTYAQRLTPGMFPAGTSWAAPTTIAAYQHETVTVQMTDGDVMAFTNPATDRYLLLAGLRVDGQASNATTTRGLVVGGGAGPIRFQDGVITNTALERVLVDSGQGVEVLRTTVSGGTPTPAFPAVRIQGTTHGLLLEELTIEGSPSHGLQVIGPTHTQARVTRTRVRTNAGAGMLLDATVGVSVDNNLVTGNGTGIQVTFDSIANQLTNNTSADNTGVGVQLDEGAIETQMTNTLLWGNATPLVNAGTDTAETTNLTSDPGFVGGGNYQIASGSSPAVDTGTPLTTGAVALDGTARPQGAGWDVGAFEIAGTPPAPGALSATPLGASGFLVP